jgi:lysophospholipase L1-like esterase
MRARETFIKIAAVLLMGLVLILAAILIMEVGVRLKSRTATQVADLPAKQEFIRCDRDSIVGWVFPSSSEGIFPSGAHKTHVQTNRLGLRSPEIVTTDTTATRILILGDSYAFGWGVAESEAFPRLLEDLARSRYPSNRIEVINAGMPGYGVYQQRAMLERVLAAAHVDVVISTFSLANDPVDDLRIMRYVPDRLVDYSHEPRRTDSFLSGLIRKSRFLTLVDERTQGLQLHFANMGSRALNQAAQSLADLYSVCDENELALLLVVLPRRTEVISGPLKSGIVRAQTWRARRMATRVAEEFGIPLVDATGVLLDVQRSGSAYLRNDAHWTPEGHRVVAETVLNALPPEWFAVGWRRHRDALTPPPSHSGTRWVSGRHASTGDAS